MSICCLLDLLDWLVGTLLLFSSTEKKETPPRLAVKSLAFMSSERLTTILLLAGHLEGCVQVPIVNSKVLTHSQ